MPYSRKPSSIYDDELWKALSFISETWNKGPQWRKTTNINWNVMLKQTLKENIDELEENIMDMVLTLFVQFFFCPRDDGIHTYEYFYRGSLNEDLTETMDKHAAPWRISILQADGSRHIYWPFHTMDVWLDTNDKEHSFVQPPRASGIEEGAHFDTRCLLRIMMEKGIVKKEWLTDYESENNSYALIPYEAIDKHIDEKPLDHIPDPFGVIERGETETLFKNIKIACEHLLDLYRKCPDLFEM